MVQYRARYGPEVLVLINLCALLCNLCKILSKCLSATVLNRLLLVEVAEPSMVSGRTSWKEEA